MAVKPKKRFNRYPQPPIDTILVDCRDLQEQVDSLQNLVEALVKRVETLENP